MATVLNKENYMVKVFTTNKNGKIELTEKELKTLLDEVYWEGYRDNSNSWTYSTPKVYPYWYSTLTGTPVTTKDVTISSASAATINAADVATNTIEINKGVSNIVVGKE